VGDGIHQHGAVGEEFGFGAEEEKGGAGGEAGRGSAEVGMRDEEREEKAAPAKVAGVGTPQKAAGVFDSGDPGGLEGAEPAVDADEQQAGLMAGGHVIRASGGRR
jgi:hypothetical protein